LLVRVTPLVRRLPVSVGAIALVRTSRQRQWSVAVTTATLDDGVDDLKT
jgi:hypothetical protein